MNAFITGSHAYGAPRPDSDIDLVVFTGYGLHKRLLEAGDNGGKVPIRFGKLNLICCDSEIEFSVWQIGTEQLVRKKQRDKKPINKETAKKYFDRLRKKVGIFDNRASGT